MNREIKFRAWIEETKTMENGLFGLRSDGKASFNKDCILMQFTGLTDKKGVEIYEGDFLRNSKKELGLVVWFEAGLALKCKRKNDAYFFIPLTKGFMLNKELIGNIYENPELIN